MIFTRHLIEEKEAHLTLFTVNAYSDPNLLIWEGQYLI